MYVANKIKYFFDFYYINLFQFLYVFIYIVVYLDTVEF